MIHPQPSKAIRRTARWLVFILLLALVVPVGATEIQPIQVKRTDKCPVCGMFVAKYPKWVAEIVFKDGSYAVFDGCKDMFKYYFHIGKYNREKRREDIEAIFVTEYYSTRILPSRDVFFVLGSDVLGPMGHEFIPVQGEENAKVFMADHKGTRMLKFDEVTPKDIPH